MERMAKILYYPPGRILLIVAGLFQIVFGLGGIFTALTYISILSYSNTMLLDLPARLPNISWMGHYWLASFVGLGCFVLGILSVKFRQDAEKAKFLLITSLTCFALYVGFIAFSGYHESYYISGFMNFPFTFAVLILCITGAALNFFAQRKFERQSYE